MVAEVTRVYGTQRDEARTPGARGIQQATVVLTLVGYDNADVPVAHALLRRLRADLEIKRMYVSPSVRGLGAAGSLIVALEDEARALAAHRIVLHTGDRQVAAIRTYERHGYTPIPIYEPYVGMAASLCFEKVLRPRVVATRPTSVVDDTATVGNTDTSTPVASHESASAAAADGARLPALPEVHLADRSMPHGSVGYAG
ncbi:MAG: GNAT family N-acetyltransferase [Flavobacterium sp.]|nr:GNAT family N-acetyltransferase [Aeromicrobium sp.]